MSWLVIQKWVGVHARPRWRIVENEHVWIPVEARVAVHRHYMEELQRKVIDLHAAGSNDVRFKVAGLLRWPIGETLPEPPRIAPSLDFGPQRRIVVARHGPYPPLP